MSSKIQWTDETWNPVIGCSKISAGCENCYAQRQAARMIGRLEGAGHVDHPGTTVEKGVDTLRAYKKAIDGYRWSGRTGLRRLALDQPLRWKKPRRIFVNSMSDMFHESVPFEWIDKVFAVMALAQRHTFQILTKRPERMLEYLDQFPISHLCDTDDRSFGGRDWELGQEFPPWPLPNVHLGVTAEDQAAADQRIPILLQTPAAVRFVSCEPLLGPVELGMTLRETKTRHMQMSVDGAIRNKGFEGFTTDDGEPISPEQVEVELKILRHKGVKYVSFGGKCDGWSDQTGCPGHELPGLDWVICGGESGPDARPMHPEWPRSIRDQCTRAGVPFFFKQWGEWGAKETSEREDGFHERTFVQFDDYRQWLDKAAGLVNGGTCLDMYGRVCHVKDDFMIARYPVAVVHRVGKKQAGDVLDGRRWRQLPGVKDEQIECELCHCFTSDIIHCSCGNAVCRGCAEDESCCGECCDDNDK